MPDQWGNYNLSDAVGLLGVVHGIKDRQKQEAFDAQLKTHLKGFQTNPEGYTPDVNAPDFDPKAYADAEAGYLDNLMKREDVKQLQMKTIAEDSKMQKQAVVQFTDKAEAMLSGEQPDYKSGLNFYEKAYEKVNDGVDLVINKKKTGYTLKFPDGTTQTFDFGSTEGLVQNFREKASAVLQSDKAWNEMVLKNRMDIWKYNAGRHRDAEWFVTKDGTVGRRITKTVNPRTGQKDDVIYDIVGKGPVPKEQWDKLGMMPLSTAKELADIQKTKAEARATGTAASIHNDEKLANAYSRIYGLSEKVAMDMVREDKARGDMLKALTEAMVTMDLDTEEGVEKFRQLRENLLEDFVAQPKDKGVPVETVEKAAKDIVGDIRGTKKPSMKELKAEYLNLKKEMGMIRAREEMKKRYPDVKF